MDDDERKKLLRNRGQGDVTTSDGRKFYVQVIQSKCMGAESCVQVAPRVFSLDSKRLRSFGGGEPLGVKAVPEGALDSETLVTASKSCPYHAIYVSDTETGEVAAGEPDE